MSEFRASGSTSSTLFSFPRTHPFLCLFNLSGFEIRWLAAKRVNPAWCGVERMSEPIRVIVANKPRLMRELVMEIISEQPDIEVLAEVQNDPDIYRAVDERRPDFLIIALDASDVRPTICDTLLQDFPKMRILALSPNRNCSIFYWASTEIHESHMEVSEAGVLNAIRHGA